MNLWRESERDALEQRMRDEGRLPPGQSLTLKWPVLDYAGVPELRTEDWQLCTGGLVERPLRWRWEEFLALPRTEVTSDFHCVTRWSRFDNRWEGVAVRDVCELTRPAPAATHVLVHSADGYTTNLPLADILDSSSLLAAKHDGERLAPEHGGPLRLVVPHLYGWKSAKWVQALEFVASEQLGFWEQNGYHRRGDPWKEQRFDTD